MWNPLYIVGDMKVVCSFLWDQSKWRHINKGCLFILTIFFTLFLIYGWKWCY